MNEKKSVSVNKTELSIVFLILSALSIVFFSASIFQFPSHLHAWTQSDRYALAIGYVDNGMALFLPSTNNLHPKYPPAKPLNNPKGITKADLPVVEYISAAVMKITGKNHPFIFRITTLLIGLAGLMFLFALFRKSGGSFILSLLTVLFAFFAPAFTYYLNGFIPSIPALSFALAAIFFYTSYLQNNRFSNFAISVGLFCLAALIRPPFIMPLIAVIMVQIFFGFRKGKNLKNEIIAATSGLFVFGVFQIYNFWLGQNFGSLFISNLMPAGNIAEFIDLTALSWNKWKFEYFSEVHYALMITAGLLLFLFRKKLKDKVFGRLALIATLTLLASFVYLFAMALQFPNHDYYFLDSFFLPLILLTGTGFALPASDSILRKIILTLVTIVAGILMFNASRAVQKARYTTHSWDRTEMIRQLFEGSSDLLAENQIPLDAKILVLDAYTSNVPLLLLNRKGYTVINTDSTELAEGLKSIFDYIAIPNRTLASDVIRNYPSLSQWLVPVANNGKIGLFSLDKSAAEKPFIELLMPDKLHLVYAEQDSTMSCLKPDDAFLPLIDTTFSFQNNSDFSILFESFATSEQAINGLHFVLDITSEDGSRHYDSFPLSPFFEGNKSVAKMEVFLNIPSINQVDTKLKCYIWNPGKNEICFNKNRLYFTKYDSHK
ncbi:MAG: glycosyltransferase family 39 protein [Bacteroidales bacterium]|nr:glycosyltransferase family 39 protein [Bacteroidales bacterium]